MKKINFCVLFSVLFIIYVSKETEGRQKNDFNSDFLAHEGLGTTAAPKRNYVASNFPPLISPVGTTSTTSPQNSNNPQKNTPQSGGKRDYVAPTRPTVKPLVASTNNPTWTTLKPTTPSGKRDYVNPSYKNTASTQKTATVKDLVNFYDNKDKTPSNQPSYSSILSGNKGSSTTGTSHLATTPSQKPSSQTPKPFSYSSIVAGTTKKGPETINTNGHTTLKPTTKWPHNNSGSTNKNNPPNRPLPSSFVNNKNAQGQGNVATDAEIEILSEELLKKDTNNAARLITINYQEKTTSQSKDDRAPLPLLVIPESVWNLPTIQKFLPLLDNYERDTLVNEHVTPQERNEENAFMDAIMSTTVIRHLMLFLKNKGIVSPDPKQQRDFLKQLWFNLYSRGKGKISSSGFEHIFVSELKNGEVSGLHNWIYFGKEEAVNRINYLGYLKYSQLNDKGVVMKLHFNQQGVDKPVDTMFVGTSPELEIALYTLCFVTRADNDCRLKLGGKDVNIVSHTFRYRSKNLIGSAYPQI
ncbi:endoribonuclease CG2145 [Plutella xylostella]|uniref:endoribonuclease CG2145 n=1 Tax=Plutella xylostella TaxID=51655 RepID=UPI002032D09F|nr:endoribonuclease CG2145 [Plutella xylostella]